MRAGPMKTGFMENAFHALIQIRFCQWNLRRNFTGQAMREYFCPPLPPEEGMATP